MGPQPEAEGNLPKDGSGGSSEDLPPIPIGTFAGFQPEEGTSSEDDEDGDHEETDRGGYQLLNADLNAADDEASEDEEEANEGGDGPTRNETQNESGWASFDQFPNHTNAQSNSRLDDWPNQGAVGVETSVTSDGSNLTTDGAADGASDGAADGVDRRPIGADFLAGGAHLLPPGLRDVPPPRVASLGEGVRQVWAGRRIEEASVPIQQMGKVEDIRKAMSSITLPSSAVPDWANQLSDDEWRKALSEKLNTTKK